MEPLQERGASPCLALQTPVLTYHIDELRLVPYVNLGNILEDAIDDDTRDKRRTRFVLLVVCARCLVRLGTGVHGVTVTAIVMFGSVHRSPCFCLFALT